MLNKTRSWLGECHALQFTRRHGRDTGYRGDVVRSPTRVSEFPRGGGGGGPLEVKGASSRGARFHVNGMAVALTGRCIGLLALVVLLYGCCYAFRIREGGQQAEQRSACGLGRCGERTTAASAARRWHEARKPPVEVTSSTEERLERTRTRLVRDERSPTVSSREEREKVKEEDDGDEDDDEAVVEVQEDSEEEESRMVSEQVVEEELDGESEVEEEETSEEVESKVKRKAVREDEDREDKRVRTKEGKVDEVKLKVKKDEHVRLKVAKEKVRVKDEDESEEKEEVEHEEDQRGKERDVKQAAQRIVSKVKEKLGVKPVKREDKSVDDEDKEDEDDSTSAAPAKKLEKVRHLDKDRIKHVDVPVSKSTVTKPKIEATKLVDTVVKPAETSKKPVESTTKPVQETRKSTMGEKKGELKATKPEIESSKPKVAKKTKEKEEAKPEGAKPPPKSKDVTKQPEKTKVTKSDVKASAKPAAETPRSERTKPKAVKHGEAFISLTELNEAILRVPTFMPNFTAAESPECQQHGKIFLRQLRGYKLWALQMLDSSAKVPSGLLRGNVNQLGDFDQCLGVAAHVKVDERTIKIQGKYCLASVDLHASHPDMRLPVNLMQARGFIRGSMRDPGHFIPKFTTVNWALCLPSACSAKDAETALERALIDYNVTTGIRFTIDVDPDMCYVKQKSRSYSKETIGVLYFYAMVLCVVIVATVRDYIVTSEGKGNYSERIIMSFSLRRTMKYLLKENTSETDITCIHGIRALVTVALYIAHQLIPIARIPFPNRVSLTEVANTPVSSVLRVSLVYTDAFLLLSGVLTAYNMAHEFSSRGEIRWFCRYIARFIRLTPALLVVIFWYAFVMEHLGSGPQWNNVIVANAELCKTNAWTNILYIQNFFPFEEMCATHTHQLALDMQLSLIAPILVFFLLCKPIVGMLLISFFVLLSATLRYMATINNYLSLVIFHGITLKHLYKTANLTYALPLHRATPYVFGIGLGVLLHYTGKNVKIHKVLVVLGWSIAVTLGSWSLFSPWHLARRDYVYDPEEATNYAVISPVSWALALCWLIFACFTEHGGVLNKFLSNYWLLIFSRISYAVYLTQFAVFFYNVGTTRYSTEFQLHRAIDPLEAATVVAVSIILTLFFDLPMQEVKSVIMESTDGMAVEVADQKDVVVDDKDKDDESTKGQRRASEKDEITGWNGQTDVVVGREKRDEQSDEETLEPPFSKKPQPRRRSFIGRDAYEAEDRGKSSNRRPTRDEDDYLERGRRSRTSQRGYQDDSEEEALEFLRMQREREEAGRRNRRSHSRSVDNKRLSARDVEGEEYSRRDAEEEDPRNYRRSESRARSAARESDDYRSWEFVSKDRPPSRGPDTKRSSFKAEEYDAPARQARTPVPRGTESRKVFSSESEEEPVHQRRAKPRKPVEPQISDEEDWEDELRIRRRQFMERLKSQERESLGEEEDLNTLKRRSSAEGRIALLKDPSGEDNMDSWTVSVGPRVAQMGSSQEPSEPEDDIAQLRRREYRERAPSPREDTLSEEEVTPEASRMRSTDSRTTSLEEEEDAATYNFVLTRDSKRMSLQDLSRLSQEDSDPADSGWNVIGQEGNEAAPRGLFKRESIVKSQASEEDPEFILPERPKLVQQEREHPFKRAWQMQKSRSEEDGSSAYAIKDAREQTRPKEEDSSSVKRELSGEHSEDTFADDEADSTTVSRSRSSDTEENRTGSKSGSEDTEVTSVRRDRSTDVEEERAGTDEDSSRLNWPSEEEKPEEEGPRSEEVDWEWGQEET